MSGLADLTRRGVLGGFGAGVVAQATSAKARIRGWHPGALRHLIPSADHARFRIKASFVEPLASAPQLHCAGRRVAGTRSDSAGRFWTFDVEGLAPATRYCLKLLGKSGKALCSPWDLSTFPAPDAPVERVRLLVYTCAGGDEDLIIGAEAAYVPLAARRALLARALSFAPDAVIVNGDHIYYDERTMLRDKPPAVIAGWRALFDRLGMFDRRLAALGTGNEAILARVGDRQIAALYGTLLRSTPAYFVGDDHDLFDNDEANPDFTTLPPDAHMLDMARAAQQLYYPELLGRELPATGSLPGRLNEAFGSLRYGKLVEALIYDTKRFASLGDQGGMIPSDAEAWLAARTRAGDTAQLLHVPSTPFGWSAGKWGEWYPDILAASGRLTIAGPKQSWPAGWWAQHQRILQVLSAQTARPAVTVSGDLHMLAAGRITRSGALDLSRNPVHTIVAGPLGTGGPAYPSTARGILPAVPVQIGLDTGLAPTEKNGFTLLEITPGKIEVSMFAWRPPEPLGAIATLKPIHRYAIETRS